VQVLLPEQGIPAGEVLDRLMGPPLFPITTEHLRGSWTFGNYDEGWFDVRGFRILAREVPHKGGRTMGLRVEYGASSLAYLPDHAPQDLGHGARGLGVLHEAALELAAGVDLLVHDAQYTALELPRRGAFGHAAAEYAVDLAVAAGARRVALFHHDPARTDAEVAAICDMLRRQAREAGHSVDIVAAHANAIFTI
jgi:phosphoribosyl 1,2-cyclic phosphodiesterase